MLKFFYSIFSKLMPLYIGIGSTLNEKAKRMIDGRKRGLEVLQALEHDKPVFWFHCASAGEFEQAKPIIEQLKKLNTKNQIVISFFSPSGYDMGVKYDLASVIFYLPFDGVKNAKRLLDQFEPTCAIFIKYEFWYFMLKELSERKIPTYSVSSIFRSDQLFFKVYGGFFRNILTKFDHLFVQTKSSRDLLWSIGVKKVTVSGDTRFDRVFKIAASSEDIDIAKIFCDQQHIIVLGSTWNEDIHVALPFINKAPEGVKFIIAPHELNKKSIDGLCKKITSDLILYSGSQGTDLKAAKVLIIDNVGMLSRLYQYADIAYVGGAFGDGLHNILEPAAFGVPILFGKGPDNRKYQEAIDLIKLGAAFEVEISHDFDRIVGELLSNPDELRRLSDISASYIKEKAGATNIVLDYLKTKFTW